jgi:hypothetical protein
MIYDDVLFKATRRRFTNKYQIALKEVDEKKKAKTTNEQELQVSTTLETVLWITK